MDEPTDETTPLPWLSVRRYGGLLGREVQMTVDLGTDNGADEVRDIAERALAAGEPRRTGVSPDRYVYEFGFGRGRTFTVAEQDLTDDLRRLVELVLAR